MRPAHLISDLSKNFYKAIAVFLCIFLLSLLIPDSFSIYQKRAILIFVFAAGFWSMQIIPLYATSLIVVLALSFLLAFYDPNDLIEYQQFLVPFSSPIIMLFFGGFILAAALKKQEVDVYITQKIFTKIGTHPVIVLYSYLFLSAFFSMWISNTASAAMMLVLIKPMLSEIEGSFKKGLVLAIAFGASIGGIGTPIGTPPNAIAVGILAEKGIYLDFLSWMMMAVPLVILILVISGIILLFFFSPKNTVINFKSIKNPSISRKGILVLLIACLMIIFWLTTSIHKIPEAVIALMGVAVFSSFGLIDKEDLKKIDWDILILMWGGLALGQGILASKAIEPLLQLPLFSNYSFLLIIAFCILAVLLSSFMSNTATANLLLPIAISFTGQGQILLSITVALCCSFALAFPVSTPPNAMAYSLRIFEPKDMLKAGGVITVIAIILVLIGFEYFITRSFSL